MSHSNAVSPQLVVNKVHYLCYTPVCQQQIFLWYFLWPVHHCTSTYGDVLLHSPTKMWYENIRQDDLMKQQFKDDDHIQSSYEQLG